MPSIFPDGDYEHGATWVNANDRAMWQRTFTQGTDAMRKQAVAAITANPATPEDEIRGMLTMPPPPAPSGLVKVSPTLDDVLNTGPSGPVPFRRMDDFSGTPAGLMSGDGPSLHD